MTSRRSFLRTSVAVASVTASANRVLGANDRPAYGVIGTGNRARGLNKVFQNLGARCVALCDVYAPNLELARQDSPPDAKPYVDYKDLLAQPGLDFVLIGTPDHQHCPNLLDALAAGKDVYLEKPLSHSLDESARMIEAVRRTRQVVQIGMQRRSMEFMLQAKKLVDEGILGTVSAVKPMWNWHFAAPLDNSPLPGNLDWERFQGSASQRPLEPMRFRWWRGFWAYSGGNMTDQGTHLMDVVQWMTNSGPPRAAVCHGYLAKMKGAEVPDVFCAVFEYPSFMATWTLNYATSYQNDWSIVFHGDKASMVMDRRGCRIYKDPGLQAAPWNFKDELPLIRELPDTGTGMEHQQNFLECIRSRKEPNCTVEIAAAAVAGPHLANVAFLQDRKVKLSADGARAL